MYSDMEFYWDVNDDRLSAVEDLVLEIFKVYCVSGTENEVTELPESAIPEYYPKLLHDFYRKCAPIKLMVGDVTFFHFRKAFFMADMMKGKVLPIAYEKGFSFNPSMEKLIFIDKNINGVGYDSRIQMGIGNEKVKILGDNIFSFICSIGENQILTVSFEED